MYRPRPRAELLRPRFPIIRQQGERFLLLLYIWVINRVLHLVEGNGFHNNVILTPLKDNNFVIRIALEWEKKKFECQWLECICIRGPRCPLG